MVQGVNSYEEIVRNPGRSIIDWEFISNHPESKLAIWQRYQLDAGFKNRIDAKLNTDLYFRKMFEKHFASYLETEETRGR